MSASAWALARAASIAETGPTAKVLGDPQNAYTRKLIASLPVPDPALQAERRAAWKPSAGIASPPRPPQ